MPVLPQFTAPSAMSTIRPSETGEQAIVRSGMRIEEMAQRTGQAYERGFLAVTKPTAEMLDQHFQQADVLKTGSAMADFHSQQMKAYNEQSKGWDPDDPTAPDKFMDQYKQGLQQIAGQARTDRGSEIAQTMALQKQEHMENVVMVDTAYRASHARVLQFNNAAEQEANTAGLDVSYLPHAIANIDTMTQHGLQSPNLNPEGVNAIQEAGVKAKKQIAQSALEGTLTLGNLSAAQRLIASGQLDPYIARPMQERALQEAQRQHTGDAERAMVMRRMQEEENGKAAYMDWFRGNVVTNPQTGELTLGPDAGKSFFAKLGQMDPGHADLAFNMLNHQIEHAETQRVKGLEHPEWATADPSELTRLNEVVGQVVPDAPRQIGAALAANKITAAQANRLTASYSLLTDGPLKDSIVQQRVREVQADAKVNIMPHNAGIGILGGQQNPDESAAYSRSLAWLTEKLSHATSPQQALDWLNPDSKDTILPKGVWQQFAPVNNPGGGISGAISGFVAGQVRPTGPTGLAGKSTPNPAPTPDDKEARLKHFREMIGQ